MKPERRHVNSQTWHGRISTKSRKRFSEEEMYWIFFIDKTADKRRLYKEAKDFANKAIVVACTHFDDINGKLGSRDGERYHQRFTKIRHSQTWDVERFFGIRDKIGHLLWASRWFCIEGASLVEEDSTVKTAYPVIPLFFPHTIVFRKLPRSRNFRGWRCSTKLLRKRK